MTEQRWISVVRALNLAEERRQAGEVATAEKLCREVLHSHPTHAPALHLLAVVLHQKGELASAIPILERAISARGDVALYRANLGEMLRQIGRVEEAIAAGRHALELEPNDPHVLNNLGIAYYDRAEYGTAAECYRRALALAPEFAEAHSNLGNARLALGDVGEALACYRRTLALKPDNVDGHNNLAMTLLLGGDLPAGWRELEWRRRRGGRRDTFPPQIEWQGEPLAGKTLFVEAEEGHGDAIQFMRYLPEVAARGARIVLAVHRPLLRLAAGLTGPASLIALGEPPPPFDLYAPLMSMPLRFGTTLETVPATVPYLSVDPGIAERWKARLSGSSGLKVGVVWSGAVQYGQNRSRAMAAEQLIPLLDTEGVSWFSLQVGPPSAEIGGLAKGRLVDLAPELTDFAETAGAILGLDLVISTDTAVPHLAGALGRPAWVMLAFVPDWRWMLEREDNPWYPTLRLFRQRRLGDWVDVVQRVKMELAAVLGGGFERLTPFFGTTA